MFKKKIENRKEFHLKSIKCQIFPFLKSENELIDLRKLKYVQRGDAVDLSPTGTHTVYVSVSTQMLLLIP